VHYIRFLCRERGEGGGEAFFGTVSQASTNFPKKWVPQERHDGSATLRTHKYFAPPHAAAREPSHSLVRALGVPIRCRHKGADPEAMYNLCLILKIML
jgi:hypothetical protein